MQKTEGPAGGRDVNPNADAYGYCLSALRDTDRDRYLACLLAPPEKQGALSALYAFNAEIARVMGIGEGGVGALISRARRALRADAPRGSRRGPADSTRGFPRAL